MNERILALICFGLSCQLAILSQAHAKSNPKSDLTAEQVSIRIIRQELTETTFEVHYEIRNGSKQDIWICESVIEGDDFEAYPEKDEQTLVIRKRLDVPSSSDWYSLPTGKYVRLYPGERRAESLLLPLPVRPIYVYKSKNRLSRFVPASQLSIEIGYYVGNLPRIFRGMLAETERTDIERAMYFEMFFGGATGFNRNNERVSQRGETVRIPYTHQEFTGERILRVTAGRLHIPYSPTTRRPRYDPVDIGNCTRVEIEYAPSMLDYFYPYQSQQGLLSSHEIEYLRAQRTILIEDASKIDDFARELKQTWQNPGGTATERSRANVSCYNGNKRLVSFVLRDDRTIETEHKQRMKYCSDLQSLREFTPQIRPFELRTRCAANLKNLFYRLRLYDREDKSRIQDNAITQLSIPKLPDGLKDRADAELESDEYLENFQRVPEPYLKAARTRLRELYSATRLVYPAAAEWCDSLEYAYAGSYKGKWHDSRMKVHVCPGAVGGRSTYAMNPDCKYDSPPDMVLLFETKGGWNQHGGPELFTFNNHGPRGGCVLFNDGTVRFLRTKEELRQLRWE